MEFEIIFDGSHRGSDQDLLCCPRLPEKREAPPIYVDRSVVARPSPAQRLVATALERGPQTREELQHATGLSGSSVRSALTRLLEVDHVEVRARKSRGGMGAPVCVYAIRVEAA